MTQNSLFLERHKVGLIEICAQVSSSKQDVTCFYDNFPMHQDHSALMHKCLAGLAEPEIKGQEGLDSSEVRSLKSQRSCS